MNPATSASASTRKLLLSDDDLRELFGLFTSCTAHEKQQIYEAGSAHDYRKTDLGEEYSYTAEKREFALDAWRAVLAFLHRHGVGLEDAEGRIDPGFVTEDFIGPS